MNIPYLASQWLGRGPRLKNLRLGRRGSLGTGRSAAEAASLGVQDASLRTVQNLHTAARVMGGRAQASEDRAARHRGLAAVDRASAQERRELLNEVGTNAEGSSGRARRHGRAHVLVRFVDFGIGLLVAQSLGLSIAPLEEPVQTLEAFLIAAVACVTLPLAGEYFATFLRRRAATRSLRQLDELAPNQFSDVIVDRREWCNFVLGLLLTFAVAGGLAIGRVQASTLLAAAARQPVNPLVAWGGALLVLAGVLGGFMVGSLRDPLVGPLDDMLLDAERHDRRAGRQRSRAERDQARQHGLIDQIQIEYVRIDARTRATFLEVAGAEFDGDIRLPQGPSIVQPSLPAMRTNTTAPAPDLTAPPLGPVILPPVKDVEKPTSDDGHDESEDERDAA